MLCDTKGVIYQGRTEGMNQWKSAHAAATKARTLSDALDGADVFFGLSAKGAITKEMVRRMADKPIIFAMANPDPEITPEEAREASPHAIIATGRSDYPNQVNNVLGFPYIFRGALDVRASTINEAMKIAAAEALANLAREDVPDEVHTASTGRRLTFGPEYIIPNAFDPRLISWVAAGGGARGDRERRGAQADGRSAALCARTVGSPRFHRGRARRDHGKRACRPAPRGVRRRRGGEGGARRRRLPQCRLRHAGADRTRGPGERDDGEPRPRRRGRDRDPQRAAVRAPTRSMSTSCMAACSAAASCSATASAWSTRTATCSPPAWWQPAMPTRW